MADTGYNVNDVFASKGSIENRFPDTPSFTGSAFDDGADPNAVGGGQATFRDITAGGSTVSLLPGDSIQGAIELLRGRGGGVVSLGNGTYNVGENIILYSDIIIRGESQAIIDFGGGAFQIKAVGSNAYSTGTISISNDGTGVVGSGTTFTAAMVGRNILLEDFWYEITAFTDTTHITIGSPYLGTTLSGVAFTIATTINAIALEGFTVQNSSVALVKLQYVNVVTIDSLSILDGLVGIDGDDSSAMNLYSTSVDSCGTGMTFDNFYYGTYFNCNVTNSSSGGGLVCNKVGNWGFEIFAMQNLTGDAVSFQNSRNCGIEDFSIREITGIGIVFVSGNEDIALQDGVISKCSSDGIKLTATTDNLEICPNTIQDNGGYGINIAASSCDNTIIVANAFSGNSSGAINDSGTGTVIVGNSPTSVNDTTGTVQVDTFLSSDTWTKPTGAARVHVELWAGGGGGGFGDGVAGGGGGGGGFAEGWFNASDLGSTETVTVGDGGTAGSLGANGTAGGDSTFDRLTAFGGGGGAFGANAAGGGGGGPLGAGGDASGSTAGAAGSPGEPLAGDGDGSYGLYGGGGSKSGTAAGGKAHFGGGGGGSTANVGGGTSVRGGAGGTGSNGGVATAGSVPGGGGGGSLNNGGGDAAGAGGKGKIIVTTFF